MEPRVTRVIAIAVREDCSRIEAIARTVAAEAGYKNLKPEQVQAVVEFVRGRDVLLWAKPATHLATGSFARDLGMPLPKENVLWSPKLSVHAVSCRS